VAASLLSVETIGCSGSKKHRIVDQKRRWSSETEKRFGGFVVADHGSI
jgi:hypothetical protein